MSKARGNKAPKDTVIIARLLIGAALAIGIAWACGLRGDSLLCFSMGLGLAIMVLAAVLAARAAWGKRALTDPDERECRIREKAALIGFKISVGLLTAFAIAALALPALEKLPAGWVALGSAQLVLVCYLGSALALSRRM